MKPKSLYPLTLVIPRCQKINLECRNDGMRLMIYAASGSLLRGFQLWYIDPQRIDADDFDVWWRFMGYDNEIHA